MKKQIYLIIYILVGIGLTACQDFDIPGNGSSVVDGNKVEVTIATNIPALTVQTRTEAKETEKQLSHVDILVFKLDDEQKERFAYRTHHTNSLSDLDYDNDIYIKAKLNISENSEEYRIVFIANLKETIESFFSDEDLYKNMLKNDLLKQISFTQTEKWLIGEQGKALPMWGETSNTTTIDANTTSGSFGSVNMLRSMARIQLGVYVDQTDGSNLLEIQEVKVHNARNKGLAAPDPNNLNERKATLPSLAEDAGKIETSEMIYDNSFIENNKLTSIYINEAANQKEDGKEAEEPVFLIMKAIYKGENYENNTKPTYYKIGFYNNTNKPVDILRNFTYNLNITAVRGPGEESEEEAIKNKSNDLTVALTDWSEGEMKLVVFNGQHYLAVSESEITVTKPEKTHSFLVKTNYPGGWKAEITEGKEWLKNLSPNQGGQEEKSEPLQFKVEENTDKIREGKIRLFCGENHLSLDVHVIQTTEVEYSLKIFINNPDNPDDEEDFIEFDKTIMFHSGAHRPITPRKLKVVWEPVDSLLLVDYNQYFAWGSESEIMPTYENGEAIITVVPSKLSERAPEDWYPEAVGDIQIQVGEKGYNQQNVLIRRRHHEVYIEKADKYILDGEKHTFKLYSNTEWMAEIPSGQTRNDLSEYIILEEDHGDYNLGDGQEIPFILEKVDDKNISDDIVIEITFWDVDDYVTKDYTFHVYSDDKNDGSRFGEEANCYVLNTGGKKVSIPVSQANRYELMKENHIGDNDVLDIKFLWTDHENGFDKNGDGECPVKSVTIDNSQGDGPKTRLIVESGSKPGNAVIAVTSGSGNQTKIHWSWHIWVVDENENFDPYGGDNWKGFRYYEFLDRNLGALSADGKSQASWGLYYQWGRKDPFPSAIAANNPNLSKRYDEYGNVISWSTTIWAGNWSNMSNGNTLLMTIQEPLKFISPSSNGTWYSVDWDAFEPKVFWNITETSSLSSSQKGIFDPCPEGWKSIPAGDQLDTAWDNLPQLVKQVTATPYTYSTITDGGSIDLGIWPHTGYISGSSGEIVDMGNGNYWTGTFNSVNEAYRIRFWHNGSKADGHPSISLAQMNALPVRCMRRADKFIQ